MSNRTAIFISQAEAPFLATIGLSAKEEVPKLLLAYADYNQKTVVQEGEKKILLWNCCSTLVTDIMTNHYIQRKTIKNADKERTFERSLGAPVAEDSTTGNDSDDDDNDLVLYHRQVNMDVEPAEYSSAEGSAASIPLSSSLSL